MGHTLSGLMIIIIASSNYNTGPNHVNEGRWVLGGISGSQEAVQDPSPEPFGLAERGEATTTRPWEFLLVDPCS